MPLQYSTWLKKIREPSWLPAAFILILTVAAYLPALRAGFIWDDDSHLTQNPCIIGPLGFKEIWTSSQAVYYPLVLTTFWILHKFVGLAPLSYHLLNLFMHAGSAILLWRVLRQLDVRGAWFGAALWALHPVMVQSVAWITELKNTQSCFFYLLSILFFLKADSYGVADLPSSIKATQRNWRFALSLLFFAMAITSKPSTVMLPVVLALCLWWRSGRLRWRDLGLLAPFLLISAAASGWTIWEQKFSSGALGAEWAQTWPQRLVIAGYDIWFYLGKLLWPNPLIFIYPRWKIDIVRLSAFLPLLAAVLGLFLLSWKRNSPLLRPVFFAAAYFVISLFPVLGFFNVYFFRYSFVSDHFQYLASIGPLALAASGVVTILSSFEKPWLQPALCGTLLLTLGALTWRQSATTYSDLDALWRATLAKNPDCSMAYNNVGFSLQQQGQVDDAIAYYHKALGVNPEFTDAHNNLGQALLVKGEMDEAITHLEKALHDKANYAKAHNNLGIAFMEKGRVDDALVHLQKALEAQPNYAKAHNNLGVALIKKGEVEKAMAEYQRALQIEPDYPEAQSNFGDALLRKGEVDEAIAHYQKALQSKPELVEVHNHLGNAFREKGQLEEAIAHYSAAVKIRPDYPAAQFNLANALAGQGKFADAVAPYEAVLRAWPDNAEVHNNLAVVLGAIGRTDEAMKELGEALRLKPDYADAHYNLGYVLSRRGQRAEAVAQLTEALRLKPDYPQAKKQLRELGIQVED